jgi:hypothetical protein
LDRIADNSLHLRRVRRKKCELGPAADTALECDITQLFVRDIVARLLLTRYDLNTQL